MQFFSLFLRLIICGIILNSQIVDSKFYGAPYFYKSPSKDENYGRLPNEHYEEYNYPQRIYSDPYIGRRSSSSGGSVGYDADIDHYLADESMYTAVRTKPDPSYSSFVRVQLPAEGDSSVQVNYVSKCNNTLFLNNIEDSSKFQQCFLMSEKLLCSGDSIERTYRLMLGDTLYKHCFPYMNMDSLQVPTVKQLHLDKTKVEVYCENSIPVTKCQCSNYLIEQERKYSSEKRFLADKVSQLSTDFDACHIARESLTLANESAAVERDRRNGVVETLNADLKMCEEEKDKEQVAHIHSGAMLQNCTKLTQNLQKYGDSCKVNLTIARKSLDMCTSNISSSKEKRQQEYNACEATRTELEKKIAESAPHDAPNCERVDIPLQLRKYLKVVLQRGYTQQARLFGINPDLQSSSYMSKYGSVQQFTPAVPIIPPRHLLVGICGEHCAELRRKRVPTEPLLTTKYTFSEPSALLNTRRYRTATGLSLEVSGAVHVWEQRFPLDTEQFHVGMYKSKRTQFFALREEGKNFEYCVCPMYEKDLSSEAQEFLDNMSQVDKALVSGEFKERKPDDPRMYWQRTQASKVDSPQQSQQHRYQMQRQQHIPQSYMDPTSKMQQDGSQVYRRRNVNTEPRQQYNQFSYERSQQQQHYNQRYSPSSNYGAYHSRYG